MPSADSAVLRRSDLWRLGLFAMLVWGYAAVSGRPLTMHEARLPQTTREMLHTHRWLLPTSGGRPWLERPPLPHWCVAAAMAVTGRTDAVWVARLPSAAMGTATVLLTTWMAARCFGRTVGLLSGAILATSHEFSLYAGSAEDDVYLAAIVAAAMAIVVRREFATDASPGGRFWAGRPWDVLAFFAVVGLSNLAKGPLLGVAFVGSAVGAYAVWDGLATGRWATLARYAWLWGGLVLVGLTVAWPWWALRHVPDVADNWRYDYLGRVSGAYTDINQPWWYYAPTWAVSLLPWTPACVIGLLATAFDVAPWLRRSRPSGPRGFEVIVPAGLPASAGSGAVSDVPLPAEAGSPARSSAWRLVWCWAFVPLLLLSVPHGKHHHYLVPLVAPSAMLAAAGAVEVGRFLLRPRGPAWLRDPNLAAAVLGLPMVYVAARARTPYPPPALAGLAMAWTAVVFAFVHGLRRGSGTQLAVSAIVLLAVAYGWAMTFAAGRSDHTLADTAFLGRVRAEVPPSAPLLIDAKLGPVGNLDFFRCQFYSRPDAVLLHNLSYLRADTITAPTVYVIARGPAAGALRTLGSVALIDASPDSHEATVGRARYGNLTLFRLTFDPHLKRYPAPTHITSLQAMERAESTDPGPYCGPPL